MTWFRSDDRDGKIAEAERLCSDPQIAQAMLKHLGVVPFIDALLGIKEIAESWHGDDEAKGRALAVIARRASVALDGGSDREE